MKISSSSFPGSLRLPVRFDVDALHAELLRLLASPFFRPPVRLDPAEPVWALPLRAALPGGPVSGERLDFADTPLLALCPLAAEVMDYFRCPLRAVSFRRLAPGASVREESMAGDESGLARLRLTLNAVPGLRLRAGGRPVRLRPGECWYHADDLALESRNDGRVDAWTLELECAGNDWLRAELLSARPASRPAVLVGAAGFD